MLQRYKVFAVVLVALAALPAWAIRICSRCSYEVPDGSANCTHCGAEVPIASSGSTAKPATDAPAGVVTADLVEKEIEEGSRQLRDGAPDVAAALFRNAVALDLLTAQDSGSDRGERLRQLLQSCVGKGATVKVPCRECGGTGKASLTMTGLDGGTVSRRTTSPCRSCSGSGFVLRNGTVTDVKAARAAAVKRYVALQQSRKRVPVGAAWVPVEMEASLRVRDTAVLKRATALPCDACLGLGAEDCSTCKGVGTRPCSKCKQGWIVEKVKGGFGNENLTRKVRCRTCGGTGREVCAGCLGRGNVPCQECKGTGERSVCSRCDGAGLFPCSKCGGKKTVRGAPCTACAGEGVVLCPACRGDGKKKSP